MNAGVASTITCIPWWAITESLVLSAVATFVTESNV